MFLPHEESDDTWSIFFEYRKERGLQGIELIISNTHKGLVFAIRKLAEMPDPFLKKYFQYHSEEKFKTL